MRRYFVQFPHPGPEGGPQRTGWARGNSSHVRKFVVAPGTYKTDANGTPRKGEIAFWTEWEGESVCEPLRYDGARPQRAPQFVHRPVAPALEQRPRGIPQNTDPFVFDDRFLYTFCAQSRTSAKRLHDLAPGSVIVFGSVLDRRFVLDTVFVVAGAVEHSADTWAEATDGLVPEAFRLATLEPMYAWPASRHRTFTLYFGATPSDDIDGMFSFVPSLAANGSVRGFARAALEGIRGISSRNARAVKFNSDIAETDVSGLWSQVVDRVLASGLALGTRVELREDDLNG